jgi:hypothetical protein
MTPEEHSRGKLKAERIATYLVEHYTDVSSADYVIRWLCYGHRDAYYLLCGLFRLKRLA